MRRFHQKIAVNRVSNCFGTDYHADRRLLRAADPLADGPLRHLFPVLPLSCLSDDWPVVGGPVCGSLDRLMSFN